MTHNQEKLDDATVVLQSEVSRMLGQGISIKDIVQLADSVQQYIAERASVQINQSGISATSPVSQGARSTVGYIRTTLLPLISGRPHVPAGPCVECGHPEREHRNGKCFLCAYLFTAPPPHDYVTPEES